MAIKIMRHILSVVLVLFYSASAFCVTLSEEDLNKPMSNQEYIMLEALLNELNEKIGVYDFVGPFYQGKAMVVKGDKMGFINKSGDLVIPLSLKANRSIDEYESLDFSDLVFVKGLYADEDNGVIDEKGNRLTPEGKMLRLYKEYSDWQTYDSSIDKADKGVIIAEIEQADGGTKSFIFENGALVYVMDNDYPILHEQTGRCLKETIDGKTTFIGEKGSKKLGYEDVFNSGSAYIPNPEVPWVKDGKSAFIMNRHGRYGIVDENCNVLHPFLHNFVLQHLNGLAILYHGKDVEDEMGDSRYLMSCDVYKDGKKIVKGASPYMMEPSSFPFVFFHGLTPEKMKEINSMLGVNLPMSTKESFILTQQGEKVDKYPWGENFLKYIIDANDIISWQLVDANGKKVIDKNFFLLAMTDKYLKIAVDAESYKEYIIDKEGNMNALPSLKYDMFKFIEFGALEFENSSCYSRAFGVLLPYNYLLSKQDNKENASNFFYDTLIWSNRYVEHSYSNTTYKFVGYYSDGLLRVKKDGKWKFLL